MVTYSEPSIINGNGNRSNNRKKGTIYVRMDSWKLRSILAQGIQDYSVEQGIIPRHHK